MSDLSRLSNETPLRAGAARLDASAWACLELTGEDRKGWLQGQATGDVKGLTEGSACSFCLCEPTGQLLAVVDAWALPDRILMTTARECAEPVLARVKRMTIMEDVLATEVDREVVSLLPPPNLDAVIAEFEGFEVWVLRSNRTPWGGWDIWAPRGTSLAERFPLATADEYDAARIEAGIPKWGADMGPRTLPPELGPAFETRHISYNKGCYTGQEILMRMHSRGHTNKTWMGLVADAPLTLGAEIMHRGKTVGTITSAAVSPDYGPIGAATLRNEAAQEGERVRVGETEAEVRRMPILRFE